VRTCKRGGALTDGLSVSTDLGLADLAVRSARRGAILGSSARALPAALGTVPVGTPLEVEAPKVRAASARSRKRAPLPAELRFLPARALPRGLAPDHPDPAGAAGRAPHPFAAPFLGLGLVLLFLSGLTLRTGNQGRGRSGRQ
jgi:hypothetical protein